jgi:murein DD-endopeptidase MepM/ murein hydrolase activator NlpD
MWGLFLYNIHMIENIEVQLPFKQNGEIKILQGFHGPWSHKELTPIKDLSHAVDFSLPLNTQVLAARDGKVLFFYDLGDKCYRGIDPKVGNKLIFGDTNYLILEHPDKTYSIYSHLALNSVVVKKDQEITSGQILAKTGLSGWVGPTQHLHFQVCGQGDYHSIPIKFIGYKGPLEHYEIYP